MKKLKAAVATLVGVGALVATSPAYAVFSGGATTACGYFGQSCSGFAQDRPGVGSAGDDVLVNCNAAETSFTVQATVVNCYIKGNTGDVHYAVATVTQGQASTLEYDFPAITLTSRSYQLCVGAGYFATNGAYNAPAGYTCLPAI